MCNLTKQRYYRGKHMIALENGLERRKKMFHMMTLKDRNLYVI